jgi:D-amino-acid dehydrogenase
MKVAVIGAGIIGVTTAFELAQDGHEVTVFERRIAAAEEASFASAGIISPGYIAPWAAPGMPFKIVRHLFANQAPVRFSLPLTGSDMAWMWQCWRACKPLSYERNRSRLLRLALYSRDRLRGISADLKLEYDRTSGVMVLLRSKRDSALMQPSLQILRNAAIAFRELSPDEARNIELALNPDTVFHSAIHLPGDEVANCRQFALLLKNVALDKGVQFEFSTQVQAIDTASGMSLRIADQAMPRRFDAAVVCAGVDSARLLRPLGLKIPLAAIHGYSVSASLREALNAPRSAVIDERFKVAITRLGNRVRVAGSAEIGGHPATQRTSAIQMLYKVLQDWFPAAAQLSTGVQVWKGARPMLPDGPPLLGASGIPGLWLNLGHGSSGWALSCGSARAVADLIGGRAAQVDLEGLDIGRLQS